MNVFKKAVHMYSIIISLPVLQVFKILDCFKASFVHALSVGMPAALCDTCPLQLLHTLCKNLEGTTSDYDTAVLMSYHTAIKVSFLAGHSISIPRDPCAPPLSKCLQHLPFLPPSSQEWLLKWHSPLFRTVLSHCLRQTVPTSWSNTR